MSEDKIFHKRNMATKGKRPVLPLSTPSPALSGGRSNAYSTILEPQAKSGADTTHFRDSIDYRKPSEAALNKIVTKLPIDIRENVSSVVSMALTDSAIARKNIADISNEMLLLRAELRQKTQEQDQANKRCEIYADRLHIMEQRMGGLQDNVETHQKFSFRSKRAVNRLSTTNRMLIDAFEALQTGQTTPISSQQSPDTHMQSMSETSSVVPSGGSKNATQNDKLRESLLRIAREHYRTVKLTEALEVKVDELSSKLKFAEGKTRDYEMELAELREYAMSKMSSPGVHNSQQDESNQKIKIKSTRQVQEAVDEKLKRLLDRNAFDPVDGITQMRRILSTFEIAPTALHTLETALYLCSREICKIFDVEAMCLFIYQQGTITKYTTAKTDVEMFHLQYIGTSPGDTSVVQEVLKMGQPMRLNHLKEGRLPAGYNPDIDGCADITTKRLLAIPIQDRRNKVNFGVLTFVNKSRNAAAASFSELDEIFATIFADHASILLSSCILYRNVVERSDLLHSLLESSSSVMKAIPDPKSLASSKVMRCEDVLMTLESVARDVLKCHKCRAVLVAEHCNGAVGSLLALDVPGRGRKPTYTSSKSVMSAPVSSGIAGHVVSSGHAYLAVDPDNDPLYNPLIDLEAAELTAMLTVPIMDLFGTVIACLQVVPGPSSPKLSGNSKDDNGVNFEEATDWLVHQVATGLSFLIKHIGKSSIAPMKTPKSLATSDWASSSRLSLLPREYFEETRELTVNPSEAIGLVRHESSKKMRRASMQSFRSSILRAETADNSDLMSGIGIGQQDDPPIPFGYRPPLPRQSSMIVRTTFKVVETYHEEEDVSAYPSRAVSPVVTKHAFVQEAAGVGFEEHARVKAELEVAKANMRLSLAGDADKTEKMAKSAAELELLRQEVEAFRLQIESKDTEHDREEAAQRELKLKIAVDKEVHDRLRVQEGLQRALERETELRTALEDLKALHSNCPADAGVPLARYEELTQACMDAVHKYEQSERDARSLRETVQEQRKEIAAHCFELEQLREDLRALHDANESREIRHTHSVVAAEVPTLLHPFDVMTSDFPSQDDDNVIQLDAPTPTTLSAADVTLALSVSKETSLVPTPSAADLVDALMKDKDVSHKDWLELADGAVGTYFYNRLTGESSLHLPDSVEDDRNVVDVPQVSVEDAFGGDDEASASDAVVDGDWTRYYDDSVGRYYWYNSTTEESDWDDGTGKRRKSYVSKDPYVSIESEAVSPENEHENSAHFSAKNIPGIVRSSSSSSQISASAGGYTIEL